MPRSTKTLDERIDIKDEEIQKMLEKTNQLKAQKRALEQKKKAEERKSRNHHMIQIGGAVMSVLGRDFIDGDDLRILNFLKGQERNGGYFTKAMNKDLPIASNGEGSAGSDDG